MEAAFDDVVFFFPLVFFLPLVGRGGLPLALLGVLTLPGDDLVSTMVAPLQTTTNSDLLSMLDTFFVVERRLFEVRIRVAIDSGREWPCVMGYGFH